MTDAEVRRAMGFGQGTLAQKRQTHCDPFEVQPVPEIALTQQQATWLDVLINSGQVTIWPR